MIVRIVRMNWLAMGCAIVLATGLEAKAQSSAATAAQSAQAAANYQNMTMGAAAMTMPGMFGSPTPSATDAAALGMGGGSGGGMMGMGGNANGNPFMNPMAAPFLYGSMLATTPSQTGITPQQTGMLMLAAQAQMLGLGSGQASGVRPGGMGAGGVRARQMQNVAGARGTTRQPGGLAARYFNRTSKRPRIPQGFYNRPNQHYPQVVR
jgi:hypothetical protein